MNEFENRMNALRSQFKAERIRIQKDSSRTIGRLNNAIGAVDSQEARDALRAEKARVFEATREAMKYNRLCYRQQLDALNGEYSAHRETTLSVRKVRRLMTMLYDYAGDKGITVRLADGRSCTVSFA